MLGLGHALSANNKVQYQQEQTFDKQADKSHHKAAMSFLKHQKLNARLGSICHVRTVLTRM